jgi:hypothetical protein
MAYAAPPSRSPARSLTTGDSNNLANRLGESYRPYRCVARVCGSYLVSTPALSYRLVDRCCLCRCRRERTCSHMSTRPPFSSDFSLLLIGSHWFPRLFFRVLLWPSFRPPPSAFNVPHRLHFYDGHAASFGCLFRLPLSNRSSLRSPSSPSSSAAPPPRLSALLSALRLCLRLCASERTRQGAHPAKGGAGTH